MLPPPPLLRSFTAKWLDHPLLAYAITPRPAPQPQGNLAAPSRVCTFLTLYSATSPLPPLQNGVTTLHWAARFGQLSLIDKLVDKGADVNAKDNVVCFHLPLLAACPLGLCA